MIDATTMCLYRVGYSAVSFAMVAEEAGVSRGIITYHFATKADLMVAVRDTIQQDELRALEATQSQIGAAEYLRQLPTLVLNGMRREPAIAVNEILLAARGDPELIGKLRSIEEDIDKRTLTRLEGLYREAGMEPPHNLPAVIRLAISTFRGLAIADLALGERADIDASLALFRSMMAPVLPR
ncbi:AcrR family transcriptional regulator [Brevundimonas nasdae]|uniref:TetR/AcrR family transcriptional regulator n=1 Tax=Brevundimonas nasdae TaxID=172043 RepID=UPI0019122C38|nr:TetR/AcrR family transcriptional regulator [Brevundimonas nasdae]MBK6024888.1 TetR/AcrR family transcriptional regulator [Brevundimonas nasdae]MDQ0451779.1 AcrR family transcriptional regulator [Brevundimonas nasdae]